MHCHIPLFRFLFKRQLALAHTLDKCHWLTFCMHIIRCNNVSSLKSSKICIFHCMSTENKKQFIKSYAITHCGHLSLCCPPQVHRQACMRWCHSGQSTAVMGWGECCSCYPKKYICHQIYPILSYQEYFSVQDFFKFINIFLEKRMPMAL